MSTLEAFHPDLQEWFRTNIGTPTEIQESGWREIQNGSHVLITATTGSGKTLAAFFAILDQFARGDLEAGRTRVLYISPLKALNNDIQKNLLVPIQALAKGAEATASLFGSLRIGVRSGDTPSSRRQQLLRSPPEILITTPESLMLLLTTVRGRLALQSVETVILDEIHAVMENRRGVQLMACVERLVEIAGEVQRIGLSATVKPIRLACDYLGGCLPDSSRRPVQAVQGTHPRRYELRILMPEPLRGPDVKGAEFWRHLSDGVRTVVSQHSSTLVFTNSRRLAERVTLELNRNNDTPVAYSHHGCLSKEVRLEVEDRFKNGELNAIVATSSLELGIDIGDLDQVVLIGSPHSVTSALQRIGRAGHQVGGVSRAAVFPTHARDFVDAAVLLDAVRTGNIEPVVPVRAPLDLLAQLLVSMAISETWQCQRAFRCLKRSWPYAELTREQFELVLEMLSGRYEDVRIRSLRARLAYDRAAQTFAARKGTAFVLYSSSGTIPDRGYFQLKHAGTGTKLGELDEEFVWEARVGNAFTFGTQAWRIERITDSDVEVLPAPSRALAPPFWRAEAQLSSFHLGQLTGEFLQTADRLIAQDSGRLGHWLAERGFDEVAALETIDFLRRQRDATSAPLPGPRHIVQEHILSGPGGVSTSEMAEQLVLHTTWGGKVNRPIALALRSAWKRRFGWDAEIFSDNRCIATQLQDGIRPAEVLALLSLLDLESDLRASLEQSEFFGARFRESAGRALLLSKRGFKRRTPLWLNRLNARRLISATANRSNFPVTLEAWRSCLSDEFDLDSARSVLVKLASGEISVTECCTTTPSPFAADLRFAQVSEQMYATDALQHGSDSTLESDLIREAVRSSDVLPTIQHETVQLLESRIQRREPGYPPSDLSELEEWVKERVWIPVEEWFADVPVPDRVTRLRIGDRSWLVHKETADNRPNNRACVESALQFYGPASATRLEQLFPVAKAALNEILHDLCTQGRLVAGLRVEDSERSHFCDTENLETALRIQRASRRPSVEPIALERLAGFLANRHELGAENAAPSLSRHVRRLRGYVAPVEFFCDLAWRTRGVLLRLSEIDTHFSTFDVTWRGQGLQRLALYLEDDPILTGVSVAPSELQQAFPDPEARYTYRQIAQRTHLSRSQLNAAFWDSIWNGTVSAEGLAPLDRASQRRYALGEASPTALSVRQIRLTARRRESGWPGLWRLNRSGDMEQDPLSELEVLKERARVLLDRYGIATREVSNREGGIFSWKSLFPALRLMELSGEIVSGLFVIGLAGPQFMTPWEVRDLHKPQKGRAIWISTWDPVAPTGLGMSRAASPTRRVGSYGYLVNGEIQGSCTSGGRHVRWLRDFDTSEQERLWGAFLGDVVAGNSLRIETINEVPASRSEHLACLKSTIDGYLDPKGYVVHSIPS